MQFVSLFSGIEAASVASKHLGWTAKAFSEVAPFQSELLKHHYPNVPNEGDITKVDWRKYAGAVELVCGGSPCFVAGTLVLTARGLIPIETVVVGDFVLTHMNRYKKVLGVGGKQSNTIIVKGNGHYGLECTKEHPILSMEKIKIPWKSETGHWGYRYIPSEKEEWVAAKDLKGKFWSHPTEFPSLPIPLPPVALTPGFFYFVGYWLGNGWITAHKRIGRKNSIMKRVYVCCAKTKKDTLREKLRRSELHFYESEERTAQRFCCSSTDLYNWLFENFSKGALDKTIPAWVFGMDPAYKDALYQGYHDADGCSACSSSSVSWKLTVGLKLLHASYGRSSGIVKITPKRSKCVIEGRTVNEHPYWVLTYTDSHRHSFEFNKKVFGLVRSVTETGETKQVYNIEVEDDNSYTADGIIVHNCQSYSQGGKRGSLDDPRGRLMYDYIRAVKEIQPEWFLWENVPGCLSAKGNPFGQLIGELSGGEVLPCPGPKWGNCGIIPQIGPEGYSLAWRILDAKYFGVPQVRRRVFLVGHRSANIGRVVKVLFEPSMDTECPEPLRRSNRSTGAHGSNARLCYENHKARRFNPMTVSPTVVAYWGTGGNNVPIFIEPNGIRQFTPEETERIQGFPVGYTAIHGEKTPKGHRYQALGNSWAVPVVKWIFEKMEAIAKSSSCPVSDRP